MLLLQEEPPMATTLAMEDVALGPNTRSTMPMRHCAPQTPQTYSRRVTQGARQQMGLLQHARIPVLESLIRVARTRPATVRPQHRDQELGQDHRGDRSGLNENLIGKGHLPSHGPDHFR
ncbi:hypothetical protein DOTSEDRAFT_73727 [Dothistroma septosporum NZE10]|uniref:Uncharacterized protein n=1 Tax=Dothistroma septosporum (strain NZE10 / CBS 128990) TaxID=675120 RepID=N1PG98_DOTSN|nr:hypothetical protein DOTSEDRAFT_73727 [Dothistroma septosporum NZE10]